MHAAPPERADRSLEQEPHRNCVPQESSAQDPGPTEAVVPLDGAVAVPVTRLIVLLMGLAAAAAGIAYTHSLSLDRALLQTRLASQERKLLDLREQLTKAEVYIQEKDAELASREVALADATQPELPVQVTFRPAWMGQGMVATFRNVGSDPLTLMVEFRDPNLHSSMDFAFVVAAGASADVGHAQGWLVNSGQSVRVSASGFKSVTAFAP